MVITHQGIALVLPHAVILDHLCTSKMIARRLQSAKTVEVPIVQTVTNVLLALPAPVVLLKSNKKNFAQWVSVNTKLWLEQRQPNKEL